MNLRYLNRLITLLTSLTTPADDDELLIVDTSANLTKRVTVAELRGDAGGGITNSASANVIPKSDGTNLVSSSIKDDGSLVTITGADDSSTILKGKATGGDDDYFTLSTRASGAAVISSVAGGNNSGALLSLYAKDDDVTPASLFLAQQRALDTNDQSSLVWTYGGADSDQGTRWGNIDNVASSPTNAEIVVSPLVDGSVTEALRVGKTITLTLAGNLIVLGLPTADPHVANALWNSSGTLMVSAG